MKKQDVTETDREYREKLPGVKLDLALRRVLDTREGRAVVRWLISESGFERSSFNTNALQMAYLEGRRSIGLMLSSRAKRVSIDAFKLMQEEADE